MKTTRFLRPLAVLAVLLCVPVALLAKTNLADYNLRLHIYDNHWNQDRFGYHAFGQANLFDEQGQPHGLEFTYDCGYHLMASSHNEAYPARWKKPGQVIEVLFGEIGAAPGTYHSCEFKISEKAFVYFRGNGGVGTESAQEFLQKHPGQVPATGPGAPDVPGAANQHRPYWPY